MFEDTLMIIKPDYMHKRRQVLLKLLAENFQIQGSRKLNFSPELAAEFYAEYAEDKRFMLEVILLSKGTSEAFILTKVHAVEELLCTMICYFRTAVEMERNVHVTKKVSNVAREINFIFPNYIHEPTPFFERNNFCNRPLLKPLISEIYQLMKNVDCSKENWKVRLADHLTRTNPTLPEVSNQCSLRTGVGVEERGQQTTMTYTTMAKEGKPKPYHSTPTPTAPLSSTSPHSSMLLSTSSCVTCGGFERSEPCYAELDLNKRVEPHGLEKIFQEEEIIWQEIVVYEEMQPEEEPERAEAAQAEGEGEGGDDKYVEQPSDVESNLSLNAPTHSSEDEGEHGVTPYAKLDASEVAVEEEASVEEAPAEEAPVEEAPAEQAPPEEALAEEAPAEEAPAEEVPAEEAPAEEIPPEEEPAEEAPPPEEASAEEAPVEAAD